MKPNPKILISYGRTRAYLDAVRYITNNSSGLMGFYLHKKLLEMGLTVEAIVGDHDIDNYHLPCRRAYANEASIDLLKKLVNQFDIVIILTAFNDFQLPPQQIKTTKMQKRVHPVLTLNLEPAASVLQTLMPYRKPNQLWIGFSAQDEIGDLELLRQKRDLYDLDWIVGNSYRNMGKTQNQVVLLSRLGETFYSTISPKQEIAEFILKTVGILS